MPVKLWNFRKVFEANAIDTRALILLSALCGTIVGGFQPEWNLAIESAQTVAGIVTGPMGNPNFVQHSTVYSFWLIQIPALLLRLGVSEWQLSVLLSAFQGTLVFAAITATTLNFCSHWLVGLIAPWFLVNLHRAHGIPLGHAYYVNWIVTPHTAGNIGLMWTLLSISLLSLGFVRSGALCLGLLPSVHPSLAVAGYLAAGSGAIFDKERCSRWIRRGMPWLGFGLALFVISFAVQQIFLRKVPTGIDMTESHDLATFYVANGWSVHNSVLGWMKVRFDLTFIAVCGLLWPTLSSPRLRNARFLLGGLAGVTFVGLGYVLLDNLANGHVFFPLKALLIPRWLNLNNVVFPAMIFGLLGQRSLCERRTVSAWILVVLFTAISVNWLARPYDPAPFGINLVLKSVLEGNWAEISRIWIEPGFMLAVLLLCLLSHRPKRDLGQLSSTATLVTAVMLSIVGVASFVGELSRTSGNQLQGIDDESSLFDVIRHRKGQLLCSFFAFQGTQLRSRRSILYAVSNGVPYVPASAPASERALKEIYGVSLRDPNGASLFLSKAKELWEQRGAEEWRGIGQSWCVSDILVPSTWKLDLPLVAKSVTFSLYEIPNNPVIAAEDCP